MMKYRLLFLAGCVCAGLSAPAMPRLWQQEGAVLSDFRSARSGEWRAIDYESERFNGTMLYAPKGVKPEAVTVDPALKGWHRVYVATFATGHDRTARLQLRLEGDGSPSLFRRGEIWDAWTPGEKGAEVFWKCADLTGKRVTGLLGLGFHGVSPILHRGVQLLWEKPLVDRFRAKHPDIDPRTLSLDDPRLAEIRCALVTENFMRPLLRRLDAFAAERGCGRLHINPIVPCTIADCRRQGLDVEEWVREGLVDSVVFGMMRIWEDEGYRKLFRILKIDGISISAYHPNWIG